MAMRPEQGDLFDTALRYRRTDPETSRAAAPDPLTPDGLERMSDGQYYVLRQLAIHGPMTDETLVARTAGRLSPSGTRTRRAELARQGAVIADGEGMTASGRRAILWRVRQVRDL